MNMRLLPRFKSPVVVALSVHCEDVHLDGVHLEEVHLVVGRGERGCVQVAWDSRETIRYRLRVAAL